MKIEEKIKMINKIMDNHELRIQFLEKNIKKAR
jgi:hypothetical protein